MANIEGVEYGADLREGYLFGHGQYCGAKPANNTPVAMVAEALKLGWSNGCPRARFLTERDPERMMIRYVRTNQWFTAVLNLILYRYHNSHNPDLYLWLAFPKRRREDEPVGLHEPLSVPKSHLEQISPMSAIAGYATPRILLEVLDQSRPDTLREAVIKTGQEPMHFLAHLSETAVRMGAKPERVLHHVYAQGVLDEENCRWAYVDLAEKLERYAPTVWKTYENLPQSQRLELAIAEIPA